MVFKNLRDTGVLIAIYLFLFNYTAQAQLYLFEHISLEDGLPNNRINDMIEDSRGFFWLATDGTGLIRYDGYEFKSFSNDFKTSDLFIYTVDEDDEGNIWAGVKGAFLRFDGKKFDTITLPENKTPKRLEFYEGSTFVLLQDETMLQLKGTNWSEVERGDSNLYMWELPEEGLRASLDVSNNLVISNGLDRVVLSAENGLPNFGYKNAYLDSYGVIWLYGTKGLVKLESMALKLYPNFNPGGNNQINAVHIGDGGKVYGGYSSGILKIDDKGMEVINAENGFPYGLTLTIEEYANSIWYGTEGGLVRERNGSFELVQIPGSGFGGFVFIMKTANDKLWIGSGTDLISYSNNRFENISQKFNLPSASVYSISQSTIDQSLWCATFTQGFFRLHEDKWEVIKTLNGVRLDSLRFSCFTAVSKNEIWAASLTEGLFHIDENGVTQIPIKDLGFAEVAAMQVDEDGNLWAASNKGILKINEQGEVFRLSELMDFQGLPVAVQSLEISENKLVAGSSNGVQVLDIEDYNRPRPEPKIALTGMKMFLSDSLILPNYAKDSIPFTWVASDLELPHDLNFLSFDFAGLSSYEKSKLQYRYRLIGESESWTIASGRREAVWSTIKPGKYIFEAEVRRLGESWSKNSLKYEFTILRPIWLRWWFLTISSLTIIGITILLIRGRIQRIQARLELENNLMDMERKALRLQMNPHFIFNALDSISSFIFKKDPEKAVRYLNNFAKLMRLTLESSMEHLHPVETEVSILKNYLELEKLRFQGKFEYSIDLDEEIDYDIGIPPMLIQPHVENAILHGLKPMKSDGQLDLRFILNDDEEMLIVEIEDNGIGRKKAKELGRKKDHRSMATKINKDRLRLLKMSMNDKIDIQIIDKEDTDQNSTGTKVIIKLPAENI